MGERGGEGEGLLGGLISKCFLAAISVVLEVITAVALNQKCRTFIRGRGEGGG
jgi:hypothetical protein